MTGQFDQESFDRDTITTFISAYPRELVMDVIKTIFVAEQRHRRSLGWKLFTGLEADIPKGMHRMTVKGLQYVRSVEDYVVARSETPVPSVDRGQKSKKAEKTSTAVRRADMRCPLCQSEMFREPICRGCKEGKAGFRVRLICGDNDEHTWIV
jgi:hypothetical protein